MSDPAPVEAIDPEVRHIHEQGSPSNADMLAEIRGFIVTCCQSARSSADAEALANLINAYTTAVELVGH